MYTIQLESVLIYTHTTPRLKLAHKRMSVSQHSTHALKQAATYGGKLAGRHRTKNKRHAQASHPGNAHPAQHSTLHTDNLQHTTARSLHPSVAPPRAFQTLQHHSAHLGNSRVSSAHALLRAHHCKALQRGLTRHAPHSQTQAHSVTPLPAHKEHLE